VDAGASGSVALLVLDRLEYLGLPGAGDRGWLVGTAQLGELGVGLTSTRRKRAG